MRSGTLEQHSALRSSALLMLIGMVLIVGCGRAPDEEPEPEALAVPPGALVQVGEEWILETDLQAYLAQMRRPLHPDDALEELIRHAQLAQAAKAQGVDALPAVRTQIRMLLATQYLESMVEDGEEIDDTELMALYEGQKDRFTEPGRIAIAVLRREFSADGRHQAVEAIATAREHFHDPEQVDLPPSQGFGPAASLFSDEPDTRFNGGLAGWVVPGRSHFLVPAEVIEAAAELDAPGAISPVIVSEHAAWLVRLTELHPSRVRPFEAVRDQLLIEWRQQQHLDAFNRHWEMARDAFPARHLTDREGERPREPQTPHFPAWEVP